MNIYRMKRDRDIVIVYRIGGYSISVIFNKNHSWHHSFWDKNYFEGFDKEEISFDDLEKKDKKEIIITSFYR